MSDTVASQNGRISPGGRGTRRRPPFGLGLVMGLALVLGPLDVGPRDGARTPGVSPASGQAGAALGGQERLRGNPGAPITLLEFSDFTCGFCLKFFRDTWPRLKAKYVDTGKVRFLYRDYPRANEGPGLDAAIAARCAGDQGRYWDMHDRLFASGVALRQGEFHRHAAALGLKAEPFSTCLDEQRYREEIFQDRDLGNRLGFRGTPGFLLLRTEDFGKGTGPVPAVRIPGAFPYEVFEQQIERLLQPAPP